MKKQNIPFILIFTPLKHRIYPEFLPEEIQPLRIEKTRLEQLKIYLKTNSDIKFIDLTATIKKMKKKRKELLYYKTDTHWNNIGLFYAYKKIINYLKKFFPKIKITKITDYNIYKNKYIGDLSYMLNCTNDISEIYYSLKLKKKLQQHIDKKNKIIIFHDSFFLKIKHFFKNNFKNIKLLPYLPITNISLLRNKPNIIIFELLERYLEANRPPKLIFQN